MHPEGSLSEVEAARRKIIRQVSWLRRDKQVRLRSVTFSSKVFDVAVDFD